MAFLEKYRHFYGAILNLGLNHTVLIAPFYLLWELLFARSPAVFPHWLVITFRLLGMLPLLLLVVAYFIEEFAPGQNRILDVKEFDSLDQIADSQTKALTTRKDRQRHVKRNETKQKIQQLKDWLEQVR